MPHQSSDLPRRLRRKATSLVANYLHNAAVERPAVAEPDKPIEVRPTVQGLRTQIAEAASHTDRALQMLVAGAMELAHADGAMIAIREHDVVVCRQRAGTLSPPVGAEINRSSGISGACLRSGESVCCYDTYTDPRVGLAALETGVRSMIAVPLVESGDVIGLVAVFSRKARAFPGSELQQLESVAALFAEFQLNAPGTVDDESSPPVAENPDPEFMAEPARKGKQTLRPTARQVARSLETVRQDSSFKILSRAKSYLTIEALYDGRDRREEIEMLQDLMFERAQELGVVLQAE
jgi:putative methionine-R-sulfoxide reductase with GAF domain